MLAVPPPGTDIVAYVQVDVLQAWLGVHSRRPMLFALVGRVIRRRKRSPSTGQKGEKPRAARG